MHVVYIYNEMSLNSMGENTILQEITSQQQCVNQINKTKYTLKINDNTMYNKIQDKQICYFGKLQKMQFFCVNLDPNENKTLI